MDCRGVAAGGRHDHANAVSMRAVQGLSGPAFRGRDERPRHLSGRSGVSGGTNPGTPDPRGASRPARLAPRTAVVCWRFASGRTLRAVECALRHDNAHIDVTLRYGGDTVARTERVPDLATALAIAERWRQTVSATPGFTEVTLPPGERVSTAE